MSEQPDTLKPPRSQSVVLPALLGTVLAVLSLIFAWHLQEKIRRDEQMLIQHQADKFAQLIAADMNARILAVTRLVNRWNFQGGYTQDFFVDDAGNYVSDMPGFQALEWMDKNLIVRWVVPSLGNENIPGFNLASEPKRRATVETALARRRPTISPAVDLKQGGRGFLVYFPIYRGTAFDGCVIAVFRAEDWIRHILASALQTGDATHLELSLSLDGENIYASGRDDVPPMAYKASRTVHVQEVPMTISVLETRRFQHNHVSGLPMIAALVGLLMAALGAGMVRLYQMATNQAWMAHSVRMALHTQIKQRKKNSARLEETSTHLALATKAGRIGVWAWDIPRGNLIWDERMFELYDLPPDLIPRYETWTAAIHPDDLDRVETLLLAAAEGRASFETEYRIVLTSGATRHIHAAARLARDTAGDPVRMTGVNWDITELKTIEQRLKTQNELQEILMSISSKYLNTPLATVDDAISAALEEIGQYVHADKVYVFEYDFAANTASNLYEWCGPGSEPTHDKRQNVPLGAFAEWVEHHRKHQPVVIQDVSRMAESPLKTLLLHQHVVTVLALPMLQDDDVIGFVGFSWTKAGYRHSETELSVLKLFSQILVNIRLRSQAEVMLVETNDRLQLALQGTQAGLWDWNIRTGQLILNERWAEIVGYRLRDLEPTTIQTWVDFCHPDDLEEFNRLLQEHFAGGTERYLMEARMRHKNGTWIWVLDSGQVVQRDAAGKPVRMVGTHLDITDRKNAEEQIRHMATHDALTNLPTLHLAKDRILMAMANARRNQTMTAVLFIDLDGFKQVNDTFGHETGDSVLKAVSRRFQRCVRQIDTVCRIGGDEFLIVLMELHSPDDAAKVAAKILQTVTEPIPHAGHQACVGASIGIALYTATQHDEDVEALIHRADEAMYTAKRSGKNQYVFADFEPGQP